MVVNILKFVKYVKNHKSLSNANWPSIKTTLDSNLQNAVQTMLDNRLAHLSTQNVYNGAVLAVEHTTGEILVWAVAGKKDTNTPGRFIDAVTSPRQPGSALKPFLYSLALNKGWSTATIIDDSLLTESVGNGLHSYQNYSRNFHGPIPLRQALGNSLNIPALKALNYVGVENYLNYLHDFEFKGLNRHPNFYGDGIALGNGEVTLYELVQAYTVFANQGRLQPLTPFPALENSKKILNSEIAFLIGNILSDPAARAL